jgi:putative ABC transport system permease protein
MEPALDVFLSDLRLALRKLFAAPAMSAVALLTLALGIGATTAFFSVLNGVLIRPLPYAEPDQVVRVQGGWGGEYGDWLSQPEIRDLRERAPALAVVGGYSLSASNLTGDGEPDRVVSAFATPDLFDALGVQAARGRTFTAEEGTTGGPLVALLSAGLFERRFGGDPAVIGREIEVTGRPRTVVGVLPADFRLPTDFVGNPAQVLMPLVIDTIESRGSHYIHTVARLAPGATAERATREIGALGAALTAEGHYEPANPFSFRAVPIRENVFGDVRPALLILLGAVGFVLLIACANVANLLLARGEERHKEMAVRAALGADRGRLSRQVLTESVLLSLVGGALGVAVAFLGTRALIALDPGRIPRLQSVTVDPTALAFTALVAILTGVVFGVLPALQAARTDVQDGLREGGRGGTAGTGRQRVRRALATVEVALAVVLVVGAGLMVRTLGALRAVEPGFDAERVLTLKLSLPSSTYPTNEDVVAFYDRLVNEAGEIAGVRETGAVRVLPLSETIGDWSIDIEGHEEAPGENPKGDWQSVTPGYFEAMGIRLVEGRLLEASDGAAAPPVAVVNRTMAQAYWPRGALGQRFRTSQERPWVTIVGVVEDVRRNGLLDEPRTEMYHAHAQYGTVFGLVPRAMALVVKSEPDPAELVAPVRALIRRMDPSLPISEVRAMDDILSAAVAEQRFTMTLLTSFGAVALLMAAVGIYGVLAYSVTRRTHEIGIRMALGAGRARVLRLVLGEGLRLAGIGVALGMVLAAALTRVMASLLYGVAPLDPLTFALVPAVLAASALAATGLPALRASSVEPSEALRED